MVPEHIGWTLWRATLAWRKDFVAAMAAADDPRPPLRMQGYRVSRQRLDQLVERLLVLTPAQRRILGAIRQGLLNKQIAYELAISEATVKAHITAILRKLGVNSRTQAVLLAAKLDVDQPVADSARA